MQVIYIITASIVIGIFTLKYITHTFQRLIADIEKLQNIIANKDVYQAAMVLILEC